MNVVTTKDFEEVNMISTKGDENIDLNRDIHNAM
jgi:hypothetical protein